MEVNTLIREIQLLPLSKRFLVMEETLKSIKEEELSREIKSPTEEMADNIDADDEEFHNNYYLINEKSLAKDWLSEEDSRWDKIL